MEAPTVPSPTIFWSGAEVVAHQLPEVGFWVEQVVPKRGIVLLHGKYGSYKTPLSIHLAYSVATGTPFFGLHVEQTRVLYIEADTPMTGIWSRIQQMNPNSTNLDFAFLYPGFNVVQPKLGEHNKMVCDSLAERHSVLGYGLVIVDSLRTCHNMPDRDSEVPTMVYSSFARLFPGATTFIIHHDRKTKTMLDGRNHQPNIEVDNESFSGSQAWIDRATTSLKILKGYGTEKEWITLSQTKSQVGAEIEPIQLKVKDGYIFSQSSDLTASEIEAFLLSPHFTAKNRTQLDRELATYFGVTERWARNRRTHFESTVRKIW